MKNALKTMLLLTIVLNVKAQSVNVMSADLLANIRFTFNKKMIKGGTCNEGQLPVSKYLFRHGGESEVYIEGLTFLTKYNSIVGIKGLYLGRIP